MANIIHQLINDNDNDNDNNNNKDNVSAELL